MAHNLTSHKKKTKFEQLAEKRGVDLKAERERATKQKLSGKTIKGVTEATQRKRASKGLSRLGEKKKPPPVVFRKPSASAGVSGSFEEPSRAQNAFEVFKATLPFSDRSTTSITATTDNRVFNTAAEYIANNPGIVASILSGGAGALTSKVVTIAGRTAVVSKGTRIVSNTKTAKQTATLLAGIVAKMKKPAFVLTVLGAMLGTYPFAEWANLDNAKTSANMAARESIKTGDPDFIREVIAKRDEIFDMTLWENIQRLIPGVNLAFTFRKATEAAFLLKRVSDRVLKDEIIQLETGETDDAKWARVRQEEKDQDIAAVDYYNDQRKQMVTWEIEAKSQASKATRKQEKKARNNDAAFWANERLKQRELEAKDRQAIADFWTAYRKTVNEFNKDNRPSNLNFGLL